MRNYYFIKIFLGVIFLLIPFNFSIAGVFSPSSCSDIYSTDLSQEMSYQADSRIAGLSTSTGTMNLYSTRATSTGTWVYNPNAWTRRGATPLDFTGQSPWNSQSSYNRSGTLISPRHIAFANHYQLNIGDTVVFVDRDSNIITRTLVNKTQVLNTDAMVGILNEDVPTSVAYYPIMSFRQAQDYLTITSKFSTTYYVDNSLMILLDKDDRTAVLDFESFGTVGIVYGGNLDAQQLLFAEGVVSGDSGNPGFFVINNQLILAETHYTSFQGPNYGNYIPEINSIMATLQGGSNPYQVSTYDLSCFSKVNDLRFSTTQSLSLPENSSTSTQVGTILATSSIATTTYSILSGNDGSTFALNSNTGVLTVLNTSLLDYESRTSFTLVVEATDNLVIPNTATSTVTVNVTLVTIPTITTSGGGGGGGGGFSPTIIPVIAKATSTNIIVSTSTEKKIITPILNVLENLPKETPIVTFSNDLDVGSRGEDVLKLQKFLTENGMMFLGEVSGYFDSQTKIALSNYQFKNKITPASGYFGPKTRKFINAKIEINRSKQSTIQGKYNFTKNLKLNSTGEDVRQLQKFLNSKGFIISESGVGSIGNESETYGEKTKQAVKKYQEYYKNEILLPYRLTQGTGLFYEATRKHINNN
jgi:peptidoglycan hydrolase-like protein with peptidoglycan-binding domain